MKKYLKQLLTYIPATLLLIPAIIGFSVMIVEGQHLTNSDVSGVFVDSLFVISPLLQISLPIFTSIFAYRNKVNTWLNFIFVNVILWLFHHIATVPLYTIQGSFQVNFLSLTVYIFPVILFPMLCVSLLCAIIFSIIGVVKKCKKRRAAFANETIQA